MSPGVISGISSRFRGIGPKLLSSIHPFDHPFIFSSLLFLLFTALSTLFLSYFLPFRVNWSLFVGSILSFATIVSLVLYIILYKRKKIRNEITSRAIRVLRKREEVNYRNLDSKNILDAFEKAPGAFYFSYREVPEEILVEIREGIIGRVGAPASRLIEKLSEMTASRCVDARTGMTSFFVVRSEDELVDEAAFDQIVVHVKREAKMMHSVKSQVIDVPIWRLNEKGEMERRIGLLFLISGVDVPMKIREDVEIAREQNRIISDMELMKNLKQAAYDLQEEKKEEFEKAINRIAFMACRRLKSIERREEI